MAILKIYDCSNSEERPAHRSSSFCPVTNDICGDLKEYVQIEKFYQFEYVIDPVNADVIFTNDIYPQYILDLGKPMVKRMDGIFWQENLQERNRPYIKAAMQSSQVIFISKYSLDCFLALSPGFDSFKKTKVILNDAPEWIFNPSPEQFAFPTITFAACVSNWERKEKRFNSLMEFAKMCNDTWSDEIHINLIGECNKNLPSNMTCFGYMETREEIAIILKKSDAFINLSYRDAAPKTVCQAIRCGLPVLYANSGGVGEIVGDFGVPIKDNTIGFEIDEDVYKLKLEDIYHSASQFVVKQIDIRDKLLEKQDINTNGFISYKKCLDKYLETFSEVA